MSARWAVRRGWGLVAALYTAVALVGVLLAPLRTVLVGLLLAGVATGLLALGRLGGRLTRHRHLAVASGLAAFVPFTEGVRVLGHLGAALALVVLGLVLLASAWTDWLELAVVATGGDRPAPPAAGQEESLRLLLRALPLDLLCEEWVGTVDTATAARLRELLLEEFERRDPPGTARWLREAPQDPPDRYLHDDQGLSA